MENENRISFLDTDIMHHSDGSLSTAVYRKKTHTEKYLAYDSHHPTAHEIAVAVHNTLFTRAENICRTNIKRRKNEECAKSKWLSTPSGIIALFQNNQQHLK